MSTAFVFALLAGKSFASDAEDKETLIVLATSQKIAVISLNDLPVETVQHITSFIDEDSLDAYALTSKKNYHFANELIKNFNVSFNLDSNCFEPRLGFFNRTFKSNKIFAHFRNEVNNVDFKKKAHNNYFEILEDMIKFAKAHNFSFNRLIETTVINWRKSGLYGDNNVVKDSYPVLNDILNVLNTYYFLKENNLTVDMLPEVSSNLK
ncbi:MAG: hypothetical protein ACRYGR_08060 [Janthinobacterium lividum]